MSIEAAASPLQASVTGRTERIDALAVMLSYLALQRGAPLCYTLPILKQMLSADAYGTLSLNG